LSPQVAAGVQLLEHKTLVVVVVVIVQPLVHLVVVRLPKLH
jgi:hypothetical protein